MRAFSIALFAGALIAVPALASPADYRFDVVQQSTPGKDGRSTAVIRLVHIASGKTVPDAEVYELSTAPAPYKWPTATIQRKTLLRSDGQGNYRLIEARPVTRETAIKLTANVEGERSPITGTINLKPAR